MNRNDLIEYKRKILENKAKKYNVSSSSIWHSYALTLLNINLPISKEDLEKIINKEDFINSIEKEIENIVLELNEKKIDYDKLGIEFFPCIFINEEREILKDVIMLSYPRIYIKNNERKSYLNLGKDLSSIVKYSEFLNKIKTLEYDINYNSFDELKEEIKNKKEVSLCIDIDFNLENTKINILAN